MPKSLEPGDQHRELAPVRLIINLQRKQLRDATINPRGV